MARLNHLFANACLLGLLLSPIVEAQARPNDRPSTLPDRLSERIKQRLTAELSHSDTSLLLARKESLDSLFLPVVLMQELGNAESFDWCGTFRETYSGQQLRQHVTATESTRRAAVQAAQWYSLRDGRHARFQVVERVYPTVGENYSTMLWLDANVGGADGMMRVKWYEPYMANRDLQFPVHPERCTVDWDAAGMRLFESRDTTAAAIEKISPGSTLSLKGPLQFYSVFDGLRPAILHGTTMTSSVDPTSSGEAANTLGSVIEDENGDMVRRVTAIVGEHGFASIAIHQNALMLNRTSPFQYRIDKSLNNAPAGDESYVPTTTLPYLDGGRDIKVQFGGKGDSRELSVVIAKDSAVRFAGRVYNVRYEERGTGLPEEHRRELVEAEQRLHGVYNAIDNHLVAWQPTFYTSTELDMDGGTDGGAGVLRARLKFNIYAGLYSQNRVQVADGLRRYHELLANEHVDGDMYVYSVEALTQACFDFFGDEAGCEFASSYLQPAYRGASESKRVQHLVRLLEQYRYGFALLDLAEMQSEPGGERWEAATSETLLKQIELDGHAHPTHPAFPYMPRIMHANEAIAHVFGRTSH